MEGPGTCPEITLETLQIESVAPLQELCLEAMPAVLINTYNALVYSLIEGDCRPDSRVFVVIYN